MKTLIWRGPAGHTPGVGMTVPGEQLPKTISEELAARLIESGLAVVSDSTEKKTKGAKHVEPEE